MSLIRLGYNSNLEQYRKDQHLEDYSVGRIISEHKDRYVVSTETGEFDSELLGNLRYTANSRQDLPAVGDWVAISEYDEDKAIIHSIYPRSSILERQAVGKSGKKQLIATNIDYGIIVQSVNRDFNVNRLERYLTICYDSNIEPIIILSKIDLVKEDELEALLSQVEQRIKDAPVIAISNQSHIGLDKLSALINESKTYCLLGSSGVGKSTLLNNLTGEELMNTGLISQSIDRGKHITSHRELVVLKNGGILIDNPGMREVGIADSSDGIEITFDEIVRLSQHCKFKDCTHINEKGCAILEAVRNEEIDENSYENFLKLQREKAHYESTIAEKREKERNFSKMVKGVKKERKHNKF